MNKILLLLLFFLSFSNNAFSNENNECGVDENNQIEAYSINVCSNDVALNMSYSLLGFLYDEYVFPYGYTKFVDTEKIRKNQEDFSDYYKRFGVIFKDIFTAMNYITIAILYILIPYYIISGIVNSVGGNFLGQVDKSATAKRISVGVFLLVPINGITIAQIIILNASVISISGANFVLSTFLSFMQNNIPEIAEVDEFDGKINSIDETSIYWDYALLDVKKMTKIAICRNRTSQYLMEKQINVGENMDEFISCNSPNPNSIKTSIKNNEKINFTNENSFINYNLTGDDELYSSDVFFGNKITKSCNSDNTFEYSCGEIILPSQNINLEKVKISKFELNKRIIKDAEKISLSYNINEDINEKWNEFWDFLNQEGNSNFSDLSIVSQKNNKKIISYYYHQMVQNYLLNGIVFGKKEYENDSSFFSFLWENDGIPLIDIENEKELKIQEKFSEINEIAKKIEFLECVDDGSELVNSLNALNKIKNGTNSKKVSAKCLYYDSNNAEVIGLIDGELPVLFDGEDKEQKSIIINNKIKETIDSAEKEIRLVANKIYLIKKGVMNSFNKTIRSTQETDYEETYFNENILIQARQLGWGAIGSLIRRIIQETDSESKLQKSILTGIEYKENMRNNMVSLDIKEDKYKYPNLNNEINQVFNSFYNNEKLLKIEDLSITKYVDNYMEQQQESFQGSAEEVSLELFFDMLNILTENVSQFNKAMGINSSGIKTSNNENNELTECIKGNSSCGVPLIHPMQTINKLGKDILTFTTGVGASVVTIYLNKVALENIDDEKKEAKIKKGKSKKEMNKLKKNKAFKKVLPGFASNILSGDVFTLIISMFSTLFALLGAIGVFFAYILPLIPFFIFIMALIGWIVLLFQILMISNIWVALLFQPKSNGENKEGIQAIYNAIAQLLLRPSLITISLIISWFLFIILIIIVNLTVGPLLSKITETSHLLGLLDITFTLSFYAIIIYIVTQIAFKFIEYMPQKVFSAINVKATTEEDEMMKSLTQTATNLLAFYVVNDITNKSGEQIKRKNQIKKQIREERKRENKDE